MGTTGNSEDPDAAHGASGYRERPNLAGAVARYVVDGMNVIGSRPDGWWRDRPAAVRRLVGELAAWHGRTGDPVLAVFDGRPPPNLETPEGLELAFAPAADDEIVRRVAADPDPYSLVVVTSDHGLADRLEPFGAQVVGAGGFRRQLASS
jgi:predicted RNA-binding protein with PIN domain